VPMLAAALVVVSRGSHRVIVPGAMGSPSSLYWRDLFQQMAATATAAKTSARQPTVVKRAGEWVELADNGQSFLQT